MQWIYLCPYSKCVKKRNRLSLPPMTVSTTLSEQQMRQGTGLRAHGYPANSYTRSMLEPVVDINRAGNYMDLALEESTLAENVASPLRKHRLGGLPPITLSSYTLPASAGPSTFLPTPPPPISDNPSFILGVLPYYSKRQQEQTQNSRATQFIKARRIGRRTSYLPDMQHNSPSFAEPYVLGKGADRFGNEYNGTERLTSHDSDADCQAKTTSGISSRSANVGDDMVTPLWGETNGNSAYKQYCPLYSPSSLDRTICNPGNAYSAIPPSGFHNETYCNQDHAHRNGDLPSGLDDRIGSYRYPTPRPSCGVNEENRVDHGHQDTSSYGFHPQGVIGESQVYTAAHHTHPVYNSYGHQDVDVLAYTPLLQKSPYGFEVKDGGFGIENLAATGPYMDPIGVDSGEGGPCFGIDPALG